jgi:hypothetical protein
MEIAKIYESKLEKGYGSQEPSYGRYWILDDKASVGFLSYDSNPSIPALKGKGI